MKNIILLIILILTSSTLIGQTTPFTINAEGEVASSKAFHSLKSTDSKKPDGNVQGCKCNGTKVVKSGDGLINVPCPCGKNCTCGTGMVKASPQLPEKYFILITATPRTCSACNTGKQILNRNGWIEQDKSNDGRFHYIEKSVGDLGQDSPLYKEYNVDIVPTYILYIKGKEVDRVEGAMSDNDLLRFWNHTTNVVSGGQTQVYQGGCANGQCGMRRGRR